MAKTNNKTDALSVILGSGFSTDNVKTLRDVLTFEVSVKPIPTEGKPLSHAELNKLRVGNGLGQSPNVSYGSDKPSKRKTSKAKPTKANANKDAA